MLGAATRDIVQRAVAELGRHAPRLCAVSLLIACWRAIGSTRSTSS
jgi:hypothetical protein